jgi:hypothetical protein
MSAAMNTSRILTLASLTWLAACSPSISADDTAGTTTSPGSTNSESNESTSDANTFDDGDDETDEADGTAPIPDFEDPIVPCDTWAQDCPDGEKCVPYASSGGTWDAHKCVPISGDGQLGEPCVTDGKALAIDDCGFGLFCWGAIETDGQLIGQCAAQCTGDADDPICGPGTACVLGPAVCGLICDPESQDCPGALACSWTNSEFTCVASEGVALGQPCESFEHCEAGTICLVGEFLPDCAGSSCCTDFCHLDEPECQHPQTECVSFFEEGVGWSTGPGVCVLPE